MTTAIIVATYQAVFHIVLVAMGVAIIRLLINEAVGKRDRVAMVDRLNRHSDAIHKIESSDPGDDTRRAENLLDQARRMGRSQRKAEEAADD